MRPNRIHLILVRLALAATGAAILNLTACTATRMLLTGREKQVKHHLRPVEPGPYVIVFGFDGAGYDQLNEAIQSGKAPNLQAMLGKHIDDGVYEHAYSAPNAITILPSTTVAAWSSIFTGATPAYTGVTGNEWFVRQEMRFYAPAPVSVSETDDTDAAVTDDLVGKALMTPTLFRQAGVKSAVSLNYVYKSADYYTTVDPSTMVSIMGDFVKGAVGIEDDKKNIYVKLDQNSVPKMLDSIEAHGMPKLQVVYFPGIDLYTHVAVNDPLKTEVGYLERITDPLVGQVLDAYKSYGILDETYVVIIADHGHTPVLRDPQHALGADPDTGPAAVVKAAGFRPRKFQLKPAADEQDFQSVFAYQGAISYLYLADRSTCPNPGQTCDWKKPPRFKEDVMPVVRALYKENQTGDVTPRLKGTIDLIFARRPVQPGTDTLPFEIFDGKRLVKISDYLDDHPRPDLIDLDRRMRWLSAGPYGDRAGDILLLTKTGLDRPIERRFYFSGPYNSWHGSASWQDSHIPLIVACPSLSGADLKLFVEGIAGDNPSELDLTPIVRALLAKPSPAPAAPVSGPAAAPSATPVATPQ
jgi:Type I phosphodiesterase / nucleotide pyrophosphatase